MMIGKLFIPDIKRRGQQAKPRTPEEIEVAVKMWSKWFEILVGVVVFGGMAIVCLMIVGVL